MMAEPVGRNLVNATKAGDPALRSTAREIDACLDMSLMGGVYLW
jgi:hypothetical protein